MTPLYKSLKSNGTTFYCFASAAEDISAAYQNANYKMYFSKYVLLDLPKQSLESPLYFDFDSSFKKSAYATTANDFSDAIVESLRNYVANQETVIKESRLNNSEYYYDTNALETTTEKIFWKWCRKLNIIDFEPAIPNDEYFSNLNEFESKNVNDDEYFPEYLWKEREVIDWSPVIFRQSTDSSYIINMEIEFSGDTNLKVGDTINIYNISNSDVSDILGEDSATEDGVNVTILKSIKSTSTQGQRIIIDVETILSDATETTGQVRLVYEKLVKYIGEVNGVSNNQEANRSYTEVYAHIPDHTGATPDILFRIEEDVNYRSNMTFPIIPSQYQPEILGAESFNSPIVNQPQNYPGSYFGQFDTIDFTYKTSTGDSLRRSGDYYGVSGDINNPVIDSSEIDGLYLDFNTSHYVKMNIPNRVVTNFDQFNAMEVDNNPPKDFEFNAILWYYTVEDSSGNSRQNLYGISFIDNPNNNPIDSERGLKFPSLKKLVANGNQDGTSYAFNLNLNFNIINENPNETYNPQAINSLFSMNLFNDAMAKLASTNDSFLNILAEQNMLRDEILNIRGLLYTQTDIETINKKISNLETLLRLYSSNQLISSNSVEVVELAGSPPSLSLEAINSTYATVYNYRSSEMYSSSGLIPINLSVPRNRDFLINITNDDIVEMEIESGDNLTVLLDRDLYLNQSVDVHINASVESTQNKKLDLYMTSNIGSDTNLTSEILLIGDIDLPIYYNQSTQSQNTAYWWKDFKFTIDFDKNIQFDEEGKMSLYFKENVNIVLNSINTSDVYKINNLFIGVDTPLDFSGQYLVDSVVDDGGYAKITFDVSSNPDYLSVYSGSDFPYVLHSSSESMLSNLPYITLNKGVNIRITRISDSNEISERYSLSVVDVL